MKKTPTLKKRRIRPRPQSLNSVSYKTNMSCGTFIITITKLENGQIFEVFVKTEESCKQAMLDGLARTISLAIRAKVPLKDLIKSLNRTSCDKPSYTPEYSPVLHRPIYSCVDLIAQVLKKELEKEDGSKI